MEEKRKSPSIDRFAVVAGDVARDQPGISTIATRDHAEIQRWAATQHAEPATGEATASGPQGRHVNDMGAGIRFNFPGFAPFRPITWEEWFDNFESHNLVFVYEQEDANRVARLAYYQWKARGETDGSDRDDWFDAERELRRAGGGAALRYRIVKNDGSFR